MFFFIICPQVAEISHTYVKREENLILILYVFPIGVLFLSFFLYFLFRENSKA